MPFTITVTNAGRAAIVNAAKDGTNAVRIASVGVSPTATTPTAATTALPGEIKRITTIAGDAVAADTIHVTVRDETSAVYAVRSIALYLADGTLFAAYGQSDVLVEKSAQAMLLLALDVRFADIAATSLTFGSTNFLNPPATTETAGVAELATDAETSAGTDDRRTVTPKGLSFALSARLSGWGSDIWRASNDGAGSGLDADLLDGQQGSYYADVVGRLGYSPLNRAGDNMVGSLGLQLPNFYINGSGSSAIINFDAYDYLYFDRAANQLRLGIAGSDAPVWHGNNDGAGSGLDADLLRGRDLINSPAFAGSILTVNNGLMLLQHDGSNAYLRPTNAGGSLWLGAGNTNFLELTPSGVLKFGGSWAWHSGNDGAGSGLDADLLDGHDGAWYADILAHLGYTPLNRGGDTAVGRIIFSAGGSGDGGMGPGGGGGEIEVRGNGVGPAMMTFHRPGAFAGYFGIDNDNRLKVGGWSFGNVAYTIWHSGNDGGGSGLDADLLDGQDGSYYADPIARMGFWPVRQGTGIGQMTNVVHIGWSLPGRLRATVDSLDLGYFVFDSHIADVWRASNDGAGSGLDADLLDGRQASDFALLSDGSRFGSNGNGYWEKRPNGVIEQWGTITGPFSEGQQFVAFPIQFTNADSVNISATGVNNFANNRFDITIQRVSRSTDGCSLMVQYTAASTSINQIDAIDWRAVGI